MFIDMALKTTGIAFCLAILSLAGNPLKALNTNTQNRGRFRLLVLYPLVFIAAEIAVRMGVALLGNAVRFPFGNEHVLGAGFLLTGIFALSLPGKRAALNGKFNGNGGGRKSADVIVVFPVKVILTILFTVWAVYAISRFSLPFAVSAISAYAVMLLIGLDLRRNSEESKLADALEVSGFLLCVAGAYFVAGDLFPSGAETTGVKLFTPEGTDISTNSIIILTVLLTLALAAGYYLTREKRSEK
jgi:hypothetical protein